MQALQSGQVDLTTTLSPDAAMDMDGNGFQLVQQGLREIGVDMELRSVVLADWLRKYTTGTFDVDLFEPAFNSEPCYDVIRPMEYYSCAKPVPFFCHQDLMPLLDATRTEFDVARRKTMLEALEIER